ncbi:hypothetical protein T492DRAFT_942079 [Pavlovales sp. CCMP2436]|nr:hypothetical protein T492DRAFT_942079 [Pavlovales sp. CCMP2436]
MGRPLERARGAAASRTTARVGHSAAATTASQRKTPSARALSRASWACRRCRVPPPMMPRTRWSGELCQVYSPEVDAASDLAHHSVQSRAASRMLARWRCGQSSGAGSARPPPMPRARPARGRSRGVRLHRRLTTFTARTRVVSGGRLHGPAGRADGRSQLR